jgi:hypothetical protein
MNSITITGQENAYDVTIGFSQGVFRLPNSLGDLGQQSFSVEVTGGTALLQNLVVMHTAGQKSALIRMQFSGQVSGDELVFVSPFNGNSIFNASGRPMDASEVRSISVSGIEHQTVYVKDEGGGTGTRTVTFRKNAGGHYVNSIFYQQAFGIDVELELSECSYDRWQNGQLSLLNNLFYLINDNTLISIMPGEGVNGEMVSEANEKLSADFIANGNVVQDPGFELNGLTFDVIPAKDVSENMGPYPPDPWFEDAGFKGAFGPATNWAAGWSLFSKYMN